MGSRCRSVDLMTVPAAIRCRPVFAEHDFHERSRDDRGNHFLHVEPRLGDSEGDRLVGGVLTVSKRERPLSRQHPQFADVHRFDVCPVRLGGNRQRFLLAEPYLAGDGRECGGLGVVITFDTERTNDPDLCLQSRDIGFDRRGCIVRSVGRVSRVRIVVS